MATTFRASTVRSCQLQVSCSYSSEPVKLCQPTRSCLNCQQPKPFWHQPSRQLLPSRPRNGFGSSSSLLCCPRHSSRVCRQRSACVDAKKDARQASGRSADAAAGTAQSSVRQGSAGRPNAIQRFLHSPHDAAIFGLAIPALFSILLDPFMSLVDTALVGRLGAPQLASMGLSSVIFAFSNVLFSFLMVLTTPKIARAVAQNKLSQASKITAESLWVAACAGVVMTTILWFGCPYAVAALKTPPEVAKYAISYLRCRALASPAVLMLFVSVGTFRGFADTKTPLYAAVLSNLTNFGMDIFLMFGLGMGVAGAALATSISQYVSVGVLLYMLTRKGMLDLADLRRVPVFKDILPLLKTGFSLSVRSFSSIIVITMCSTMLAEMGAVTMAAHEILRQVWIFSIQAYGAFDIATQTLVATYIGKNKRPLAREVLMRILQIGTLTGCMMAVFLFATRSVLPVAFTKDSAVASLARYVMPVVALYMPMDAIASIMDGGLLGASDTNYVAVASLGTGVVAFAALLVARRMGTDLLGIWMALKLLTLGRVVTGSLRYASASSPFAPSRDHQDQDAMAQPQSQASSSNGRESENGSGKQASALQQHQTGQHEQHSSAANGHDHGNGNGNGKSKGQRRSSDVSRRVNEVSAGLASQMQDTTIPGDASGSAMGSAL